MLKIFTEEWRKILDNSYFIGAVLMDLSKAFDCIPHNLVIFKLAAYGWDKSMTCSVKNIKITFEEIISGVPQGSIVGPVLFNIFFNYFFYFITVDLPHNFTDDILFQVLLKQWRI